VKYERTKTRPSLRARIVETESRARISVEEARRTPTRRLEPSFVERYRGTEYETVTVALPDREPTRARGRAFVLLAGSAMVGMIALIVTSAAA
jgi:hypothetical protein